MTERSVSVRLGLDTASFTAKAVAAGKTLQGALVGATSAAEKNRAALTTVGNAAGIMGAAAAAGVGIAIKASANFDKAMSGVNAATRAGADEMGQLRQLALKMGADTAFSAAEAADGIEQLAKAGVSTRDVMGGGLKGALSLAAAGELEVGDAAESAATAMTQFGLKGADVPHVADLLAAAAGKAQGEVSDFSAALNQSGLVANQTGLSIEETTGALAAFASQGLIGSDAGTSLKTMLQSLTPSSEKAAKLMEELGISAYDSQGQFIGLADYAGVLQDKLSGMSAEQRNATLKTIFGSDAVRAASVIYEQGAGGISKWINKVDDAGFAADTAARKQDNLAGDIEKMQGALSTLLIETGSGAQGPLRSLTQGLTGAVDKMNELPQPVKDATLAFGGLVAVTGGAAFLGSRFITAIAEGQAALKTLGVTANMTKTAVRGIGVGVAIYGVAKGLDVALDKAEELLNLTVQDGAGGLAKDLEQLATTGKVSADLFGGSLGQLTSDLVHVNDAGHKIPDMLVGWAPGNTLTERLAENTGKLDAALASMVDGGNIGMARTAFNKLTTGAREQGVSMEELRKRFPEYVQSLDLAAAKNKQGANATRQHAGAVDRDADAVQDETAALRENIRAHNTRADQLLVARDKNLAWNQSVIDTRKEVRQGTKTIDTNTQAGIDNMTQLNALALSWNDMSAAQQKANGGIKTARRLFVDMATDMGMPRKQARALAQDLLDIPSPKPKVTVDTQQARNETSDFVGYFNRQLTGINDETVNVKLDSRVAQLALHGQGQLKEFAVGGPVPLWGARGRDSVPAMLTPDEHIATEPEVRAAGRGSVARGHQVWKAIRKMALRGELMSFGDLQYLATGGAVRPAVSERGFGSSLRTIEGAFAQVAAAYGAALSKQINAQYATGGGRPLGPGGTLSRGQVITAQNWVQGEAGKPYQWGGTGNPSWDCSGLVGGTWNKALGRSPYTRAFTTASFGTGAPYGFRGGPGIFTVGNDPGSHMASNMGGLGVESRGGDGVVLGGGITPLTSFAHMAHYDKGGPLRPGLTLAYNGTGADEYVVKGYQDGGKVTKAERRDRERAKAVAAALRQFDITGAGMGRDDVRSELRELRAAMQDALGKDAPILKTLAKLDGRILDDTKDRARLVRANEKLGERLDSLRGARRELQQTVAGNFRNDIFTGGLDDLSLQLRADTNDARRMRRGLRTARGKGLSGSLYRQLAESGNFTLAQEFAGLNRRQIRSYERMYAQRSQATGALGSMVGGDVYGPELRTNTREMHRNNRELNQHTRELRKFSRRLERRGDAGAGGARKKARGG